MPTVVGVKLRYANKILYFKPEQTQPVEGDHVVVETERGKELGEVVSEPHDVTAAEISSPLKPVLRVATDSDVEQIEGLRQQEADAMPVFREFIEKYKLDMKPIARLEREGDFAGQFGFLATANQHVAPTFPRLGDGRNCRVLNHASPRVSIQDAAIGR